MSVKAKVRNTQHENTIFKIGNFLANTCFTLAGICLVAIILLSFADIIGRYFLSAAIIQKTELVKILLALCFSFTLPVVCFRRGHIDVDILDDVFNPTWFFVRKIIVDLLLIFSLGTMGFWLFKKAERIARNYQIYNELNFSMAPIAYIVSCALFVCAAVIILRVILDVVARKTVSLVNETEDV